MIKNEKYYISKNYNLNIQKYQFQFFYEKSYADSWKVLRKRHWIICSSSEIAHQKYRKLIVDRFFLTEIFSIMWPTLFRTNINNEMLSLKDWLRTFISTLLLTKNNDWPLIRNKIWMQNLLKKNLVLKDC